MLARVIAGITAAAILLVSCSQGPVQQETSEPQVNAGSTEPQGAVDQSQDVAACSDPLAPGDAAQSAADGPDEFAWALFLYLNCPAQNNQPSPLIWETWKPTYAVYLPGGEQPSPWGSPLPPRMLSADPEISGHALKDTNGQPILYEIWMNEWTFDYILERELYSRDGQLAFFSDPSAAPIDFPGPAIEIKAAWLILDPNDPEPASRYYTIQSQYIDENGQTQSVLAGLSGFHITSKVLPNWLWATFEQVDNQSRTGVQPSPIPPDVQALNDEVHAALPAGSPWKYYNLRGTQIDFVDASGQPTLLANSLIESDFENSSSCITCHALASRGESSQGRLAFFNNTPSGIRGYVGRLDDPDNQFYDAFDDPVCYDSGLNAFTTCDNSKEVVYKLMDFVWSLREAQ
jgi:hypothetical protein